MYKVSIIGNGTEAEVARHYKGWRAFRSGTCRLSSTAKMTSDRLGVVFSLND